MVRILKQTEITGNCEAKVALFDALAEVAGALSAGRRIEIIDLLAQGERSVEDIAGSIGQNMANTSHHLRTLARAGLVRSRRSGTHIFYRLAGSDVEELWATLRHVAQVVTPELDDLAEAYLGARDLDVVGRTELLARIERGDVTILDVRPALEYRAGHIPGARSLPLADLVERIEELPDDLLTVAYCRGPYCVLAPSAVRALREFGFKAAQLEDGFPEWRRSALPVALGDAPGVFDAHTTPQPAT
ncbi:MAG: ArsR/SmtB family transcription factor [Acidimicrobiales bacterium]